MRSLAHNLVWLAGAGLGLPFALAVPQGEAVPTVPAPTLSQTPGVSPSSLDQLNVMFSPEIQTTVAACWDQGKVDLQTTPSSQGWVACRDGSVVPGVSQSVYITTVADLMTASTLLGLRSAMATDPRLTPQLLSVFITTDQGDQLLQSIVQTAIVQSGIQPADMPESSAVLTDAVVNRLMQNLQDPDRLGTLLGTPTQYSQTVSQFCSAPGMTVEAAQQQIGLDSVQLFAVCIEESGMVREVMQHVY